MARLITGTLLLLVIGVGVFAVWMRGAGGGVVDLTDGQVAAARASGAGARDIAVDPDDGETPLPTLAELAVVVDRAEVTDMAVRVRAARDAAAGEDRALLTVLLAEIERLRGNVDLALDLAREGAEALPDNSRARYTLGLAIMTRMVADADGGGMGAILGALDDVKRYQAEIQAAIELDPTNIDARVRQIITLAFAPWPIGNKKKARALIEELGPFDEFRRDFWRVQILAIDKNKRAEAIAGFEALDARVPGDEDVVYNIAELHMRNDDWVAAAREFDRLVALPRTRRAYQAMYEGSRAREKGEFELEKALAMLTEYAAANPVGELMPTLDRVGFHRGIVLMKLERHVEAKDVLEAVLELDPDSKRTKEALEELAALASDG